MGTTLNEVGGISKPAPAGRFLRTGERWGRLGHLPDAGSNRVFTKHIVSPGDAVMALTAYAIPLLIGRILAVYAAAVCFYMAFFMYKNDADVWQNRLVDLWAEIAGGSQGFLSAQAALVKKSSELVSSWRIWLLGEKLVSVQVVAFSLSMSFASLMVLISTISLTEVPGHVLLSGISLVIAFVCLLFGLFGVKGLCKRGNPLLALVITVILIVLGSFLETLTANPWLDFIFFVFFVTIFLGASVLGVFCILLLLIVNRLILQSIAATGKVAVLLFGFVYNLAWVVFLAEAVLYWAGHEIRWPGWIKDLMSVLFDLPAFQHHPDAVFVATYILRVAPASTLFTLCASICLLIIIATALAHRLFWPVAERSIYALYTNNVFTNKKLQITVGLTILLSAFPGLDEVLKKLHVL
jgi:hypothetical protein